MHPKKIHFWFLVVLLMGVFLRSVQFFGATSLWLDEVASALNIQSRNFIQLATEKLGFNQVAPLGFLWTSKIATLLFGENDEAYRLVPFVWSLVSLPLFYLVAKRFLNGGFLLSAVILFSFSYSTFLYAAQAKQYSGDLAVSLLLIWASLRVTEGDVSNRLRWLLGVLGFVGILSCFQSVPMLLLIIIVSFYLLTKEGKTLPVKFYLPILIPWLVAASVSMWFALSYHSGVKADMSTYWSRGFPPSGKVLDYVLWFPQKLYKELNFFLAWWMADLLLAVRIVSLLLLILSIPGLIYLSKKLNLKTVLLFAPLITALALAIAHQYPFANRVAFYATFPIIISGMAGLQVVTEWKPNFFRPSFTIALSLLMALIPVMHMIPVSLLRPPYLGQPMQPVIRDLKKQLQPGDIVYVYHKASYAMKFYGPREGLVNYIVGRSDTTVVPILRDLDKLRGNKRVWFVFTQWTPAQPFPDSIKTYLGNVIGKEIDKIPDPFGGTEDMESAAHLYDLTVIKKK